MVSSSSYPFAVGIARGVRRLGTAFAIRTRGAPVPCRRESRRRGRRRRRGHVVLLGLLDAYVHQLTAPYVRAHVVLSRGAPEPIPFSLLLLGGTTITRCQPKCLLTP